MGSILAIDYGLKRIGLAVSDPSQSFAFPYKVIENKGLNNVISCLTEIIQQKGIDLIIVGLPINMDKSKGVMVRIVEDFIKHLKKSITIPIKIVDERLSTFAANENLKEINLSSKQSKKFIDIEASRLLLEEFINRGKG